MSPQEFWLLYATVVMPQTEQIGTLSRSDFRSLVKLLESK